MRNQTFEMEGSGLLPSGCCGTIGQFWMTGLIADVEKCQSANRRGEYRQYQPGAGFLLTWDVFGMLLLLHTN